MDLFHILEFLEYLSHSLKPQGIIEATHDAGGFGTQGAGFTMAAKVGRPDPVS